MIDKNGNKIVPPSEKKDKNFMLAEIKFITKGFLKEKSDSKAERIASHINDFIKAFGEIESVWENIILLEEYINDTQSQDFVWEMVYIRRKKAWMNPKDNYSGRAEEYGVSATYFDKICQLRPTVHNLCCRVCELLNSADYYSKIKNDSKSTTEKNRLIDIAIKYFCEIENDNSSLYYETAQELYTLTYNRASINTNERLEALKELLRFSLLCYYKIQSINSLSKLVEVYEHCCLNAHFPYAENREELEKLIRYVEADKYEDERREKERKDLLKRIKAVAKKFK